MFEVNFDGLVGPTHNYGGLSYGNVASLTFKDGVSSPKQAALQGLKKAKALADMGLPQGIIPPQLRPNLTFIKSLGFTGIESEVLERAFNLDPILVAICSSSSYMWTANAATVAPSSDTLDKKVHLTVANLLAKPHRAIEPGDTFKTLSGIFNNKKYFNVHECLKLGDAFSDEGAANHTRFENPKTKKGLHLFVYGREALNHLSVKPTKFPARQTLEGSEAVARNNNVNPNQCMFVQQSPEVIDAGVFHNDVISVGYKNVFLYHERAFVDTKAVLQEIQEHLEGQLVAIPVSAAQVSVAEAVKTYLFNSQIVSLNENEMALIAPEHCRESEAVRKFIEAMIQDKNNPINKVYYFDLLQSMKNGGGPACLRLRVQLTREELEAVNPNCLLTDKKYQELVAWVNRHYRETLTLNDLKDIKLYHESQKALQELGEILNLPHLMHNS